MRGSRRKSILAATAAALALAACLAVSGPAEGAGFRKGPYLLYPGDPSRMTILWQTDGTPGHAALAWGPTSACRRTMEELAEEGAGPDGHLFRATLTGLEPGRLYHYRVTVNGATRTGSFRAAPPGARGAVTFYGLGDTRSRPDVMNAVLARLLADVDEDPVHRQTFCLHAGDWVTRPDEASWDREFFAPGFAASRSFLSRLAVMGCRGNHEGDGTLLRKYWPYPYRDPAACFYSFDYGPVHVTVLDDQADLSADSRQVAWLEEDLAGSDRPWKIVLHHVPAWSAGGHQPNETVRKELAPIFRRHGVTLVVAGHNHCYARCEVDGITWLTLGGGGAPLSVPDTSAPGVVKAALTYHFARFEADDRTMTVTVFRPDGSVVERFELVRVVAAPVNQRVAEPVAGARGR